MPLSDIVNVQITRATQTVSEAGFGTLLIVGTSKRFNDLIRFYNDMTGVAEDFLPSDPEYIAAQDAFAQSPRPNRLGIGRRQVDNVQFSVSTAMAGINYTATINGIATTILSTSPFTLSNVILSGDLQPGNIISTSINGTPLATATTVIDFSADFVAGNSILATVNGVAQSPVLFDSTPTQAGTMTALAAEILGAGGVTSALVTGTRQITVVFNSVGASTVNSVVTTLGFSQPVATITNDAFIYATSSSATMTQIANAISAANPTWTVIQSGINNGTLTVIDETGSVVFNNFTIIDGLSQPTATITSPLLPSTPTAIATALVSAINANSGVNTVVSASSSLGTITLTAVTPGTPYTFSASTNINLTNKSTVTITQVEPNRTYDLFLNGVRFSYTTLPNIQNAQPILDAWTAQIALEGSSFPVQITANPLNGLTFESVIPSNTFSISATEGITNVNKGFLVTPFVPSNSVPVDLDLINDADTSWYALMTTSRDFSTVEAFATWTESKIKLFGTASADTNIINVPAGVDVSSIAAVLSQAGYVRSFVMYHQDAESDYPEAAWFGRVLPLEPGSETWKFKTLASISYSNLTTNQSNNAFNKNANTYEFIGGVGITQNGTVAQGEFIDIIRGVDWLTSRIQEFVYAILVRNPKLPFTNNGISAVQSEVMRALSLGINNNFLTDDPAPFVTVPRAEDVPSADKANRILRDVKFQATLAGAIHSTTIFGTVTV